ncbi:MAG: DNA gyrase subunit A [Lentisphaerae bacterium RIFOXYB12_FULL_65_16]|nr:MAG: DNA gyrase subunit A [Lentisphaerae bacterium RIFOXYA12_64_32]OGV89345.1 MAG: DNA gyrase subunit A [Lentisphaerae bacterium RIFOXYB12_FULL_65_16]
MSDDATKQQAITQNDIPANIEEIMHSAYLQYSLSVNVGRAIPDVRDGLKPGNRRILFAMNRLGLTKGHAYTKCAKVVGEVIGNFHPHGDQAVYDTLVRMAQPFSMRNVLVDGQGNFGSIDGDAPAAYRYTECRLERLAEELLTDIDRDTVDMRRTFDEQTLEPVVLPARFPNLLVNGSTGIGVGMATNIPPHNLGEVIDATVMLIDKPTATVPELMQVMPGPDFPTGGVITGVQSIVELYETGHGTIRMRGKAQIEEVDGKERIIITEIPYALNKESLVTRIAELVNEKRLTGISGLNDESSSRTGIRIVVDLKRGAIGEVVLNQLYRNTMLQTSFGAHFLVVDRNRPRVLNLRQLLQAYIDHRLEVVTRRTEFELAKAEERAHIVQGLLIAVNNVDEVVRIIRSARTKEDAARALMARFGLSQAQCAAILEMRLHQLTGLAIEELQAEFDELTKKIAYFKELLANRKMRMDVVKAELIEIRQKYADPRRTEIHPAERELDIEDLIAQAVWIITVSASGYIKRVPEATYETQNRGGVGVVGMETKEEDFVEHILTAYTHDYLLFFTNKGLMHWLKVYEIPEAGRTSAGRALVNLIGLEEGERVRAMIPVPEVDVSDQYIVMATKNAVVKKTPLRAFRHLRRRGIRAIVLDEGDDLIDAKLTDGSRQVLLSSEAGRACRFSEAEVRRMSRVTRGVRGMELRDEKGKLTTQIVSMTVVDPQADLLVITTRGMGKRTRIGTGIAEQDKDIGGGYRLTRRGSKGVISIRLRGEDKVVAAVQIESEKQELIITSVNGQMVRIRASDIRTVGRSSLGVRVMRLRETDEISGVSVVEEMEKKPAEEPRIEAALIQPLPPPDDDDLDEDFPDEDADADDVVDDEVDDELEDDEVDDEL